jgi:hypothetical protein
MAPSMSAVPLLPCRSTDEIADFYRALGFEVVYRQARPNPYVALRLAEIQLHFFGLPEFDPERSYGSCILNVPDTAALFDQFAAGLRAAHGKLPLTGIPRITRPRRRKNTGDAAGFTVVDPGGNWIRIFRSGGAESEPESGGPLARAVENAVVLGESKGDDRQAVKILDGALARHSDAPASDLVAALIYRAELAFRLDDPAAAHQALDRAESLDLTADQCERVADVRRLAAVGTI